MNHFFFGKQKPGLSSFADLALLRLSLLYPFIVLISNSATDVWDLLLILFFLLNGKWQEKWQLIKSSSILIVACLLVIVSFIGVFQLESITFETLFKSIKYGRGHHPIPILIILATVLTTRTRRVLMLNSLGLALPSILLYSFCTYSHSPFENLIPWREAAIARNYIWFGMALVVWCGLLICTP
jgi:hypothetical protein